MPWKLILAAKKLKQKLGPTPVKSKGVWNSFKTQRGITICRAIHIIFVVVTKFGALPYRVEKLENGYRKFIPVKGLRKWLVNAIYTYMVLRLFSYALLPLCSELKLAVKGHFTADCLIWVLNVQMAGVSAIFCYKFAKNPNDVAIVYNGIREIMRTVTVKHFKGKHIFELANIHWAVVLLITSASAGIVLNPILSLGVFVSLKDSPVFLSYHISGPYSDIRSDDYFRILLYWICALVQWLYLNYVIWVMGTLLTLMGEGIIGTRILLQNIRSLSPTQISWREKNKIHAKLEVLLAIYNDWVGFSAPLTLLAGLMFTVSSTITLMKMDLDMGFPKPALIPVFIVGAVAGAFGGSTIVRSAEELRANSVAYVKEVEDTVTACALLEVRRKWKVPYCPTGRTFRRRPIGIRFGSFMYMDEGLSTSYLMQIQDNTINFFFMVDLKSHPVWLWQNF